MQVSDWLVITAVLIAPLLAIQAQKWIELMREKRNRRTTIFQELMATRATRVAPSHVQALNMIDIEFSKKRIFGLRGPSKSNQTVLDAWKIYLDTLNERFEEDELNTWVARRDELFTDLLYEMGRALGHNFDKVQIKRGIYSPQAHGEQELAQIKMRDYLLGLASGETVVPISVIQDDDAVKAQKKLQRRLLEHFEGKQAIKVQIVENEDATP